MNKDIGSVLIEMIGEKEQKRIAQEDKKQKEMQRIKNRNKCDKSCRECCEEFRFCCCGKRGDNNDVGCCQFLCMAWCPISCLLLVFYLIVVSIACGAMGINIDCCQAFPPLVDLCANNTKT